MGKQPALYHFTCAHGHAGIGKTGTIVPNVHPFMSHLGPLLWLTDLAAPTAERVGLTSSFISCDRLAYRYRVETRAAIPWSQLRGRVSPALVTTLERYGDPSHWWVVRRQLTASEFVLDQAVAEAAS